MTFSIFPRMVYKKKSKISGEIVVKEQLRQYTLHVQGMIQSGGITKGVWKRALKRVTCYLSPVTNLLVLGLGGGTIVQLIKARYPEAKIVGIEIDSEIIKIGKRFFGLDKIKNLEIINADATAAINNQQLAINNFDLIIVDLYIGGKFPKKAKDEEFLKNIKKLLSKNGIAIFNRLRSDKTEGFSKKLERHFSRVERVETSTNLFFLSSS